MENLTVEQCKALYFDEEALRLPPYQLYRLNNHGGGRFYYREVDGEVRFYTSTTTMIKSTMPTGQGLINWIADMGVDNAKAYAEERAHYGTFMHTQFTNLLINRELDWAVVSEELHQFIAKEKVNPALFNTWFEDIKKDVLSFVAFVHTHKVKPLAIEVVLCDDESECAGAVDLVCKMQILEEGYFGDVYKSTRKGYYEKGDPKLSKEWVEITAVVDFKSGKKGFYEEHEIQLGQYRDFVEQNFGIKVDKLYNFAPSDWRSEPSFKLKDQTDSKNLAKLPYLIAIGKIEKAKKVMKITKIDKMVDLDVLAETNDISALYERIELSTFVQSKEESYEG